MAQHTPPKHDNAKEAMADVDIKFSHVQLFADHVSTVEEYKAFEASINTFHQKFDDEQDKANNNDDDNGDATASSGEDVAADVSRGQKLWNSMKGGKKEEFVPHGRDVVKVSE